MNKKVKPLTKPQFEKFYNTLRECNGIGELKSQDYLVIKKIIKKAKPKSILEFGFKNGSSAAMWAAASPSSNIISTDLTVNDITNENSNKIHAIMQGGSFKLHNIDIHHLDKEKYQSDLIFIDGNPFEVDLEMDTARELNPEYVVVNNWFHPRHRDEVQTASERNQFKLVDHYATECGLALLSNPYYTKNENHIQDIR